MSQRLDAEDLADLLVAYRGLCADRVSKFGGTVAEYFGDSVLAYFGYPLAHEDDAERAIRAALDSVAGIEEMPGDQVRIQIRCGIATGTMVVGDLAPRTATNRHDLGDSMKPMDVSAVGDAPNLAARLQKLAGPNGVLISERTQRLVRDMFDYRDLGLVQIKDFVEPARVWEVVSVRPVRSRF